MIETLSGEGSALAKDNAFFVGSPSAARLLCQELAMMLAAAMPGGRRGRRPS